MSDFFQIGSSPCGNDFFAVEMISATELFYRVNVVVVESLTFCAILKTFLSHYHHTLQFGSIPGHSW